MSAVTTLTPVEVAAAAAARLLYLTTGGPLTVRQLRSISTAFGVDRSIPAAATGRLVGRHLDGGSTIATHAP